MRRFKEKFNKKGFTLAELLIVVAIIAVLVAVSVPVFNSKLERSREAVDIANMRAAKVAAAAAYLDNELDDTYDLNAVYYDADNGTIVKNAPGKGYGQGTGIDGKTEYLNYKGKTVAKNCVIKIKIEPESDKTDVKITMEWVPAGGSSTTDPS